MKHEGGEENKKQKQKQNERENF